MIDLPDFNNAFEYENNFYLSCDINRISKILAHYEIYKMIKDVPGAIVECGVKLYEITTNRNKTETKLN